MKVINIIGVAVLVLVFFMAGFAARTSVDGNELAAIRGGAAQDSGTRIASMNLEGAANVDFRPLQTLLSVVTNLRQHYVEQLTDEDEGKMTYEALKSMLASLEDPNTRFIEPKQRLIIADAQEGKFHGIGAVLAIKRNKTTAPVEPIAASKDDKKPAQPAAKTDAKPAAKSPAREVEEEQLMVVSVLPGSPAEKAGLKTGDYILAIDGKWVLPMNPYQRVELILKDAQASNADREQLKKELEAEQKRIEGGIGLIEAQDLLSSEDKKELELTVLPAGSTKQAKVKLQPTVFSVSPVEYKMLDGDYGYIRINTFSNAAVEGFADAMGSLAKANGLVIDLRNLSGGQIESATKIASWFAPGKTFAQERKSRNRKATITIPSAQGDVWSKPVAVLVDGGTARTAELFASALKEHSVAKLVGQKTYGDFMSVTLIEQPDGSAISMTTGEYMTARGGRYEGKGLPVDVNARATQSGDGQLKEALKMLESGGGRS